MINENAGGVVSLIVAQVSFISRAYQNNAAKVYVEYR